MSTRVFGVVTSGALMVGDHEVRDRASCDLGRAHRRRDQQLAQPLDPPRRGDQISILGYQGELGEARACPSMIRYVIRYVVRV